MMHPGLRIAAGVAVPIYIALLAWLSLRTPGTGASIDGIDKLYHAIAYGGLMVLIGIAAGPHRRWRALAVTLAIGIVMEAAQGAFTASREPSLADIVANSVGALCALLALRFFGRRG